MPKNLPAAREVSETANTAERVFDVIGESLQDSEFHDAMKQRVDGAVRKIGAAFTRENRSGTKSPGWYYVVTRNLLYQELLGELHPRDQRPTRQSQ